MTVREDAFMRADGSEGIYGVVEKTDFVVILAVEDDAIWLVEQYRYPVGARFWELPQGSWEGRAGAEPAEVARGELREETGIETGSLEHLGHLYQAYGFSTQGMDVFLATDLRRGPPAPEEEELDLVARRSPSPSSRPCCARARSRTAPRWRRGACSGYGKRSRRSRPAASAASRARPRGAGSPACPRRSG